MSANPRSLQEEVEMVFCNQSEQTQVTLLGLDQPAFVAAIGSLIDAELGWHQSEHIMHCSHCLAVIGSVRQYLANKKPHVLQASA